MTNEQEARRSAALRFLQTVVVVDDHAYKFPIEIAEEASLAGESLEDWAAEESALNQLRAVEEDPQEFYTERVVEGFAEIGIYCSVLAPAPGEREADRRRVDRLARRADVVILDWVLRPRAISLEEESADERTSIDFITDILREDDKGGGRIRLICIYTGESDAESILSAVSSAAARSSAPVSVQRRHGRRIDVGASRILVLGKERPRPVETIESVTSTELPERVVAEFTEFVVTGALREVAVEALSAVRDESHRLLRRFDSELDPALLSHRSVTSAPDTDQFARQLVGSELGAIVMAADVTDALSDDRVGALVDAALDHPDDVFAWRTFEASSGSLSLSAAEAAAALKLGVDRNDQIVGTTRKLPPKISRTSLLIRGSQDESRLKSRLIDAKFSMLSALSRDPRFEGSGSHSPRMQLGTIVVTRENIPPSFRSREPHVARHESSAVGVDTHGKRDDKALANYWVCLQPLCDSVRLSGLTRFPMLPLKLGEQQFHYLLLDDDKPVALRHAGMKLSEMSLISFVPEPSETTVRASWSDAGWTFKDSRSAEYLWAGSLRLDKAHKLLHAVANTAGRIGVDEFDFLRLAAPTRD